MRSRFSADACCYRLRVLSCACPISSSRSVAGAILALVVYAVITALGAILFKRTDQQSAGTVRLLYGVCGAALRGFLRPLQRLAGGGRDPFSRAIANAELHTQTAAQPQSAPLTARPRPSPSARRAIDCLARQAEKFDRAGFVRGDRSKQWTWCRPKPTRRSGKVGTVVSSPESAGRFLSYPGAKELTENPKIVALRDDPEIIELIQQQRFLDLLQNPKLIEAMNDPDPGGAGAEL